jgi:hypothetical protein
MRLSRFVSSFAGFALVIFSSQTLLAQTGAIVARSSGSGTGIGIAGEGCSETEPQKQVIEPYTGVRKTTRVQKLADGTTITHESTSKEARDSSGRTYRENQPEVAPGVEGQVRTYTFYYVNDPVSRVTINWNSNSKEATVFHLPEPGQVPALSSGMVSMPNVAIPQPGTVTASVFGAVGTVTPPHGKPARPVREDLGTKTINGVEAKGTRMTTVIPAGQAGNDQPITVIHETWMSTELRIAVLQIDSDPRTGTRTTELTEIERGEPDPVLFQPPEGYTIKDRYPGQKN